MKKGRLWFPLDVHFWDDPDVIAIGESAAILFQKLIAYAKVHATDGIIPMTAVRALGGRRWVDKLAAIVGQKMAMVTDSRTPNEHTFAASVAAIEGAVWCQIVAFLAWNDSSDRIEKRREIATEKKRKQREVPVIVPPGQTGGVPPKAGRQESEKRIERDRESASALSESAREAPPNVPESPHPTRHPNGVRSDALRTGFAERFRQAYPALGLPGVCGPGNGGPWLELAREVTDEQVPVLLDAFFADQDPFVASDRAPSKLMSQRVRLLTRGPAVARASPAKRSTEPMTHDEARAFVEQHAGKGATVHVQKF